MTPKAVGKRPSHHARQGRQWGLTRGRHVGRAPQAHKVVILEDITKWHKAVRKMVVGPPKSVVRNRLQTTLSGCYQE